MGQELGAVDPNNLVGATMHLPSQYLAFEFHILALNLVPKYCVIDVSAL